MDRRTLLTGDRWRAAEAWLGADLADVAIHTGPAARRLCRDARALEHDRSKWIDLVL